MGGLLIGMGIEAAQGDIADAQTQVLHNSLGQNFQASGEWSCG